MSNVAVIEQPRRSVLIDMASNYGMEPQAFEATLRATVFPANAPREQFAAFLLVAKQYSLNPLLKEIYAFPAKGGGIVPIVSIDGWMNLINSHPKFDGMDFEETHDKDGNIVCIRCTIYRKDRSHPVSVTEYLNECVRNTDPWKMKHRMLRHKSAIQCARYAFGFAGIYDEDEGEKIAEAKDVSPQPQAKRIAPPPPPDPAAQTPSRAVDEAPVASPQQAAAGADTKLDLDAFQKACEAAANLSELESAWATMVDPVVDAIEQLDYEDAMSVYRQNERRLEP